MILRRSGSFDRTVWFYDALARFIFGQSIRHSQIALLPYIPVQASVLILGGGTGWLLQDLARLNIPLHILYIELSPKMLASAQQNYARLPTHNLEVTFRLGTEADILPYEYFDVIFTPFVLDLYPMQKLERMLQQLQVHLKLDGRWLVADFFVAVSQTRWRKWWQHTLARLMYTFFGWLCHLDTRTLPNLDALFKVLPLELLHTQYFYHGFIRSQVYQKTDLKASD